MGACCDPVVRIVRDLFGTYLGPLQSAVDGETCQCHGGYDCIRDRVENIRCA
jgi:hypothetical protein